MCSDYADLRADDCAGCHMPPAAEVMNSADLQHFADTEGAITETEVRRYHSGRAETSGFQIADKALADLGAGKKWEDVAKVASTHASAISRKQTS